MELGPIGVIHSPYKERSQAPRQGRLAESVITLEIDPQYAAALEGIGNCSHLMRPVLGRPGEPRGLEIADAFSEVPVGVFSSRSPRPPEPDSFCVADLIRVEVNRLIVRGVDALDGSPLLDIKAYAPAVDCVSPGHQHAYPRCSGWNRARENLQNR